MDTRKTFIAKTGTFLLGASLLGIPGKTVEAAAQPKFTENHPAKRETPNTEIPLFADLCADPHFLGLPLDARLKSEFQQAFDERRQIEYWDARTKLWFAMGVLASNAHWLIVSEPSVLSSLQADVTLAAHLKWPLGSGYLDMEGEISSRFNSSPFFGKYYAGASRCAESRVLSVPLYSAAESRRIDELHDRMVVQKLPMDGPHPRPSIKMLFADSSRGAEAIQHRAMLALITDDAAVAEQYKPFAEKYYGPIAHVITMKKG